MIYTVGHKKNYLSAISKSSDGFIIKLGKRLPGTEGFPDGYPGGYAFQQRQAAQLFLDEINKPEWCVFGIEADWDRDTEPHNGSGWWHNLIHDSRIIVLDEGYESYENDWSDDQWHAFTLDPERDELIPCGSFPTRAQARTELWNRWSDPEIPNGQCIWNGDVLFLRGNNATPDRRVGKITTNP